MVKIKLFKIKLSCWELVVLNFNLATWDSEAGGSQFEANLVYRTSSRAARVTQRKSVSKNKQRELNNPAVFIKSHISEHLV